MAIKSYNGVTYDDKVDYSAAIEQAKAAGQDTSQLEAARNAKIQDTYKGKEPTMYGSNQTYNQVKNDTSDTAKQTISNAVAQSSQINGYDYTKPSNVSTNRNDYYGGQAGLTPDMSRNTALKNVSVQQGQYTVTYDENGYAVKAVHDGGASATHGYQTTHANDTIYHQLAYQAAANGNWDLAAQYMNMMAETYNRTGENDGYNTGIDYLASRLYQGELKSMFNYNAEAYYNNLYNQAYGENAAAVWDATGGAFRTYADLVNAVGADQAQEMVQNQIAQNPNKYNNPGSWIGGVQPSAPTTPELESLLGSMVQTGGPSPSLGGGFDYSGSYGGDYGYSGSYGGDYGYGAPPEWGGSEWDAVLDQLAQQLIGMNYTDWTKGDQYQALANRYGQQGKMSMQDVMGQISSRTGGLASSWAQTAAQQQYNSFMGDLERAAMEMYGVEQGELLDKAQLAQKYAQDDYNRYLDSWNQWADNRDFNYNAYRDSVADQQYKDHLEYEREQDAWEKEQYLSELDRKEALQRAELLASIGNFSGYSALGYSDDEIAQMLSAYQAANAPKVETPKKAPAPVEEPKKEETPKTMPTTGGTPTSGYGTNYSTIWSQARKMYDNGSTADAISAYLEKFNDEQLTEAGLDYILKSLNLYGYREV